MKCRNKQLRYRQFGRKVKEEERLRHGEKDERRRWKEIAMDEYAERGTNGGRWIQKVGRGDERRRRR